MVIRFARGAQILKHRNTEFAEIGEFVNQELFTPRPPRLGGAISESCFTGKPENLLVETVSPYLSKA